jgi:hypothetical protein
MSDHSLLTRHLAALQGDAHQLAQTLVSTCLARLQEPSSANASEALRKDAGNAARWLGANAALVASDLSTRLRAGMQMPSTAPAARAAAPTARLSLSELTLVDESQAEIDIEISRIAQAIDLKAEWELRELMGKVRAMSASPSKGAEALPWPSPDHYPTAPNVVARAFSSVLQAHGTEPALRAAIMRTAAPAFAEVLRAHYAHSNQQLASAGAPEPEYRAIKSLAASSTGFKAPISGNHQPSSQPVSGEAFDLKALGDLIAQLPRGSEFRLQPARGSADSGAKSPSHAALQGLFQQMGSDANLEATVQRTIARLEAAVLRLAEADPTLLTAEDHPTWRLINQIAAHTNEHPLAADPRGSDFLEFVEPVVQRLAQTPKPATRDFELALTDVQAFIAQDQERQVARIAPAQEALRQAEQIEQLKPMLRQQVEIQLAKGPAITHTLRQFLIQSWPEVLAYAMAEFGDESEKTQGLIGTLDELLSSLQAPPNEAARLRTMRGLPSLIDRLKEGMALIQVPEGHGDQVLDELMNAHRRLLFPPAQGTSTPAAEPSRSDSPTTDIHWDDSDFLQERPADRWQGHDTNVGSLPTVPMSLDAEASSRHINEWLDGLRLGTRCKIFMHGQWTTARLVWRSNNGQFYMFTSPLAGGAHSMTRRAIERLRSEGLVTDVADASLVQRAARGLAQHIDSELN